jgi:hypothetical protein
LRRQWLSKGTEKHLSIYRNSWNVQGTVVSIGFADEMTGRPYLLIDSKNGRQYFYSSSKLQFKDHEIGERVKLEQGKFTVIEKAKSVQKEQAVEGQQEALSFQKVYDNSKEKEKDRAREKDLGIEL